MKTNIIINLQFEALHRWPAIESKCTEQYLKDYHRHVFHIKLKIPVNHCDRDIEFIELKRGILADLNITYRGATHLIANLGHMSCEMIATELLRKWNAVYVSVLEDGENGAEVYTDEY